MISAVKGTPDGSFEGTPTFNIEIKGALEVTIELHWKVHMIVDLLVQKRAQNDSTKGEFEDALYAALESAPKI